MRTQMIGRAETAGDDNTERSGDIDSVWVHIKAACTQPAGYDFKREAGVQILLRKTYFYWASFKYRLHPL